VWDGLVVIVVLFGRRRRDGGGVRKRDRGYGVAQLHLGGGILHTSGNY
jgi:hypothetical protein